MNKYKVIGWPLLGLCSGLGALDAYFAFTATSVGEALYWIVLTLLMAIGAGLMVDMLHKEYS